LMPTTLNEMIKRYEIGSRRKKGAAGDTGDGEDAAAARARQSFPAAAMTRD
jgi:hypothetical protein